MDIPSGTVMLGPRAVDAVSGWQSRSDGDDAAGKGPDPGRRHTGAAASGGVGHLDRVQESRLHHPTCRAITPSL